MTDEYDRLRRRVLWTMPTGLYIVGSRAEERLNAMTLNLAMQVAIEPKRIAVAVVKEAVTHELIVEGKVFCLNVVDREDRAIVRRFVKPVEVGNGTLNGFEYRTGSSGAPILARAVAYLDCRLFQTVDVGDHSLFIGDVVDAAFQKDEETSVLRMEDTRMNYGG